MMKPKYSCHIQNLKIFHSFHSSDSFSPCILWLHTRSSFTAYVPDVFRYDIFVHSRLISWQVSYYNLTVGRVSWIHWASQSTVGNAGHCGLSVVVFLYVCTSCSSVVASIMLLINVESESGKEEVFILYSWSSFAFQFGISLTSRWDL